MFRYAQLFTYHCNSAHTLLFLDLCNQRVPLCVVQVRKFNGVEVENLRHLSQLTAACTERFMRFDLDYEVRAACSSLQGIWPALA
jgi:PDZ domain